MAATKFLYPLRDPDYPYKVRLMPCAEDVYRAVMPDIWRGIKRMKKMGRCRCPKNKTGLCDLDCELCEHRKVGNAISIETPLSEDGEMTYGDIIPDASESPDVIIEKLTIKIGLTQLTVMDLQILTAIARHDSQREAAAELHMSLSTFKRKLSKAREHAREILGYTL